MIASPLTPQNIALTDEMQHDTHPISQAALSSCSPSILPQSAAASLNSTQTKRPNDTNNVEAQARSSSPLVTASSSNNNIANPKRPRSTKNSTQHVEQASPSPSASSLSMPKTNKTRSKTTVLSTKKSAPIKRKPVVYTWANNKFTYTREINEKDFPEEDVKTPLQYFQSFVDDDVIEMIPEETNLYSTQSTGKSINVTKQDIKDFIAINLLMGIVNLPAYTDYWSQEFRYSEIANVMPLKRFQQIRRYIHFNNNLLDDGDRYYKIRPLVERIRANFLKVAHETKFSIDEMMVPYKGKKAGNRKQYIKSKPRKWGFKIFVRAGVSGFIYDFVIYGGEDTFRYRHFSPYESSLGLGAKVVIALCKTIPNPACCAVYFDNFFTSLELIHFLRNEMGIFSLGTIRANRLRGAEKKLLSDKLLKKKGRSAYSRVVCKTNKICIVKWHDNKVVTVASSFVSESPVGVIQRYDKDTKRKAAFPCPEIIKQYNAHMGGVDLADMMIALYRTELKGHRWYLPIVSQILDMCVNNSWILYRRHIKGKPIKQLSLKKFRYSIIQGLLKSDRRPKDSVPTPPLADKLIKTPATPRPTADVRFDGVSHMPTFGTKGRCKFCTKGQTTVKCSKCDMRLCLLPERNCFINFHTKNTS